MAREGEHERERPEGRCSKPQRASKSDRAQNQRAGEAEERHRQRQGTRKENNTQLDSPPSIFSCWLVPGSGTSSQIPNWATCPIESAWLSRFEPSRGNTRIWTRIAMDYF
jgi:hypothetical protein